MHVLFIHTPIPGAPFSSSIAALSAFLKQHGFTTSLLTIPSDATLQEVQQSFAEHSAEVYAWSFMTCRWDDIPRLIDIARKTQPNVKHIAGGAHPTTSVSYTHLTLPTKA